MAKLKCFECGYDLRAHSGAGDCPECAFPVSRSKALHGRFWRESTKQRVAVALACLVPLLVAMLVPRVSSPTPPYELCLFLIAIAGFTRLAFALVLREKRFPWLFWIAFEATSIVWLPFLLLPVAVRIARATLDFWPTVPISYP